MNFRNAMIDPSNISVVPARAARRRHRDLRPAFAAAEAQGLYEDFVVGPVGIEPTTKRL